jgi:hypothetical protein
VLLLCARKRINIRELSSLTIKDNGVHELQHQFVDLLQRCVVLQVSTYAYRHCY